MSSTLVSCALCSQQYALIRTHTRLDDAPGLCPACVSRDHLRELDRIEAALRKARQAELPATLTLAEWLTIVSSFTGKCALCQQRPFEGLEVWDPAAGVTAHNVVPLCRSCSFHKLYGFEQAFERITAFLTTPESMWIVTGADAET